MTPARLAMLLTPQRPSASILGLFRNGQKGGVWLPHFTRYLFQDTAMTIPAAVGMPVVKMLDLSGNGNTITFTDVTLQQDAAGKRYLSFNGTTSIGSTAAIDFTGTDQMAVCAGVYKSSDATVGIVAELSANATTNNGSWFLAAPRLNAAVDDYGFDANGTVRTIASKAGYAAAHTAVLTGQASISGAANSIRVNGSVANTASSLGTGNFGNYQMFVGARSGSAFPFTGRVYGLVACGAALTAGQVADLERDMARLTGVNF